MKIIGRMYRGTHTDYCNHCGTVFKCEFSDAKETILSEESKLYSVNCPNCGTELIIGFNENELFPWVK